jgi:hypothetical protein
MWQKLNRLDVVNLEKARVQITNVLQLVAAPLRSFKANADKKNFDWPKWDRETSSFLSNKFGENQEITVTLDIEKFILSINGSNQKKEHLVLSGMTYPMAYGWMKIKLEGFKLDTNQFDDNASYLMNWRATLNPKLNYHLMTNLLMIKLLFITAMLLIS